jgi:hypothetical protein
MDDPLERATWGGAVADRSALREAIERALGGDPRAAYDRLAPMLEPAETGDAFGRDRAREILERIDDAIALLSTDEDVRTGEGALVDARWADAADAYARRAGEPFGALAEDIARGLAWLAGNLPREPAPVVELDTGESGPWESPLLVAGVVLSSTVDVVRSADWPRGVYRFAHQYGGHACLQAMIIGFAVRPPASLTSSLAPLFEAWADSHGEALTEPDLREWTAAARLATPFPELASGHEALVVSAPCAAAPFLAGLPVLAFRARTKPWTGISYWREPQPVMTDSVPFGEAHDHALRRVAHAYSGALPCLALLWGNSD